VLILYVLRGLVLPLLQPGNPDAAPGETAVSIVGHTPAARLIYDKPRKAFGPSRPSPPGRAD